MAELQRLQHERQALEAAALAQAAQACLLAAHSKQLSALGFEFSTRRFEAYFATLTSARKRQLLQEALEGDAEAMPAAA